MTGIDDPDNAGLTRFVVLAAAVLAAVAGFVNAAVLISLIYPVSHVTGSLSLSSMDVTTGDLAGLSTLTAVLLAFFVGAMSAGVLLGSTPLATGRRYGVALLAEAALLGATPLVGTELDPIFAMVLAAAACGLQNGMFSNYRGTVLRTSHMTGTLTDLGVLVGGGGRDAPAGKRRLLATTLVTFVAGGLAGAHGADVAGIHALWAPALCCAVLGLGYATYRHRQHATRHNRDRHRELA